MCQQSFPLLSGPVGFSQKRDIYFYQRKINSATQQGETFLAHELTHTIQQGAAGEKKDSEADKDKTASEDKTPTTDQASTDKPADAVSTPGATSTSATTSGAPSVAPPKPAEVAPIVGTPLTA